MINVVDSGLTAVRHIGDTLKSNAARLLMSDANNVSAKSLSQYSQELQLRPTIAIEREILNDQNMQTLVQTAMSNYAAYYILALSIDNTINGVSVGRMVGKYSPNRSAYNNAAGVIGSGIGAAVDGLVVSHQSYLPHLAKEIKKNTLSSPKLSIESSIPDLPKKFQGVYALSRESLGDVIASMEHFDALALEYGTEAVAHAYNTVNLEVSAEAYIPAATNASIVATAGTAAASAAGKYVLDKARQYIDSKVDKALGINQPEEEKPESELVGNNAQSNAKDINEMQNLAVGRLLNVSLSRDNVKADITMLLKPTLVGLRSTSIAAIAGISKKPTSFRDRWIAFWDRDQIQSAWDWISCRDLVEAHRRHLVEDTTGYYEQTYKKNKNNQISSLLTGEFSVGTVANTWIISDMTAARVEATIGARLSNKRARDKFMAESGCMTLIVYNPDYQRVFLYNHGLDDVSEITMQYLKKKSESPNFDMDVFKLMSQGSAPII
jgi:hypothetical protein